MLSFRGDGLKSLYYCLRSSSQYCHLDALLTRALPSFYLPCVPSVGTRRNKRALHEEEPCEVKYSKKMFSKPHPLLESETKQEEVLDDSFAVLQSESNEIGLANAKPIVDQTNVEKKHADAQSSFVAPQF